MLPYLQKKTRWVSYGLLFNLVLVNLLDGIITSVDKIPRFTNASLPQRFLFPFLLSLFLKTVVWECLMKID